MEHGIKDVKRDFKEVYTLIRSKVPNYRELTSMYLDGKTQEDIIKLCKADNHQKNITTQKNDTKNKIVHFFNVIEGTKKAYIENPRARVNRTELLSYVYRKTLVSTTSVMRILEALEEQGWSLQEVTKNMEFHSRAPHRRS